MKWVCLMANMTVPGVGSLICRRFVAGAIQTVGSLLAIAMVAYCVMEFIDALKVYRDSLGDEAEDIGAALQDIGDRISAGPLIWGGVGVLILKVTWIWAQVTTAQVFKAEKKAEDADDQEPEPAVPPPLDSSN